MGPTALSYCGLGPRARPRAGLQSASIDAIVTLTVYLPFLEEEAGKGGARRVDPRATGSQPALHFLPSLPPQGKDRSSEGGEREGEDVARASQQPPGGRGRGATHSLVIWTTFSMAV